MNGSLGEAGDGLSSSQDPERVEIEQYLESDETRLGDVYRGLLRGLDADAIATETGVSTSNFVWNYSKIISALLEREFPQAPTVALQTARRYRSLLKGGAWSPAARQRLTDDLEALERRAADVEALAEETATRRELTVLAEETATSGIYVYALPHYLRYPFDPDTGRTLMKVGRSDRDVIQRMREQSRTTALPEEPLLLRIYPTGDLDTSQTETRIHKTLRAFDHGRTVARMAGREWFLTTTEALDAVADLLGLTRIVVNDDVDFLNEA
jgi:hypothetical protein